MVNIDESELKRNCEQVVREGDLETLTPKVVRRKLERVLSLPEYALDEQPWKSRLKSMIEDALTKASEPEPKPKTQPAPKPKTSQKIERRDSPVSSPKEPTRVRVPTLQTSNEDEKMEKESQSENGDKSKASGSELSAVEDDTSIKPSKKKRKTDQDKWTKPLSASTERSKASIGGELLARRQPGTFLLQTKKEHNPDAEKIKKLKSFIVQCGVRKIWSKELDGLETLQAQIRHLQKILQDLGVEGRATKEKCAAVKAARELRAEVEALNTNNILDDEKGRKSNKTKRTIQEDDDEEDGEPEDAHRELDLSFLGDQGSDSD